MTFTLRAFILLVVLTSISTAYAQQPATDPSGHWEGSISAPFAEIPFALDIARRDGRLTATYSRGDGSITNFPLSDVALTRDDITLSLKVNGGGVFHGSLSDTTMSGTFAAFAGTVPFALKRTGDARIPPPVISGPISKTLEGAWTATLAIGPDSTTFRMTLSSREDGTSVGTLADDHGVDVALKITQDDARVTLDIPTTHGRFVGVLSTDGSAIQGTYSEEPITAPITFTRVP